MSDCALHHSPLLQGHGHLSVPPCCRDHRWHRGTDWGGTRGHGDPLGARSLFQDAQLLALLQPQVPVVGGLVVVQGHHQLVWGNRGRVEAVMGAPAATPPPLPGQPLPCRGEHGGDVAS